MAIVDYLVTPEKHIKDVEEIIVFLNNKEMIFPQSRLADYKIDDNTDNIIILQTDGTLFHFHNCSYVIEMKNQEEIYYGTKK